VGGDCGRGCMLITSYRVRGDLDLGVRRRAAATIDDYANKDAIRRCWRLAVAGNVNNDDRRGLIISSLCRRCVKLRSTRYIYRPAGGCHGHGH
jgi:hypothetical protein